MADRAGERRHLLEIQSSSETEGRDGETVRRWGLFANAWGSIMPLQSRELAEAKQIDPRTSHEIGILFVDCQGLKSAHRIRYFDPQRGQRVFGITGLRDDGERRAAWIVSAQEIFDHEEAPDVEG